jgi:hypothetical protein
MSGAQAKAHAAFVAEVTPGAPRPRCDTLHISDRQVCADEEVILSWRKNADVRRHSVPTQKKTPGRGSPCRGLELAEAGLGVNRGRDDGGPPERGDDGPPALRAPRDRGG